MQPKLIRYSHLCVKTTDNIVTATIMTQFTCKHILLIPRIIIIACLIIDNHLFMNFYFLWRLWNCVGRTVKQKFGFIKRVDRG